MAKSTPYELAARRPRPQAGITETYSPPNPTEPLAPQNLPAPLPYDKSLETAGARLAHALTGFGLVTQKREQELISEQQSIRVSKMNHAEMEVELRDLARQAEETNTWAISSNPFRIKVAMENIADRVMRTSYVEALAKQTQAYANPLQPQSDSDAAQFALDTFRDMKFPGHWAAAKAAEMQMPIASNWLGKVRSAKQSNIIKMNQDDLANTVFRAFNDFDTDPTRHPFDSVLSRVQEASDNFYSLTGQAGRAYIMEGINQFFGIEIQNAINDGDVEDLQRLEGMLTKLGELKDGALALSESQAFDFAALEANLGEALELTDTASRRDIERDEGLIADDIRSLIVEAASSGKSLSTDYASPEVQEMLTVLREKYNIAAVNNVMANTYLTLVNAHATGSARPDHRELERVGALMLEAKTHEERVAIIKAGDLPAATKNKMISDSMRMSRDQALLDQMALKDPKTGNDRDSVALALRGEETVGDLARRGTDNPSELAIIDALQVHVSAFIQDKARAAAAVEGSTGAEIDEAVEAASKDFQATRSRDGRDYDIEEARKRGLPEHIVQNMLKISQARAESEERMPPAIPGMGEVVEAQLMGKTALAPPYTDNPDNVRDLWLLVDESRKAGREDSASISQITKYNAETVVDAARVESNWNEKRTFDDTQMGYPMPEHARQSYLQALRLRGFTPEEMEAGTGPVFGSFGSYAELHNPKLTGMIPSESFGADFHQLAVVNTPGMSQKDLLSNLSDNGIAKGYNAYVKMVGINDAVGFDAFVALQVTGIGRYRLPVPDEEDMKLLNLDTTP